MHRSAANRVQVLCITDVRFVCAEGVAMGDAKKNDAPTTAELLIKTHTRTVASQSQAPAAAGVSHRLSNIKPA